jgi:hypothetical protein
MLWVKAARLPLFGPCPYLQPTAVQLVFDIYAGLLQIGRNDCRAVFGCDDVEALFAMVESRLHIGHDCSYSTENEADGQPRSVSLIHRCMPDVYLKDLSILQETHWKHESRRPNKTRQADRRLHSVLEGCRKGAIGFLTGALRTLKALPVTPIYIDAKTFVH